jgi:excisionase family DNA binding protein
MNPQIPENNWQFSTSGNWFPSNPAQTSLPAPESQPGQSSPKLTSVVYTIEEAAVVLNVCTKTVRRLIDRRLLTCCRVLRKKLIPREQIERFLKATCDVPQNR